VCVCVSVCSVVVRVLYAFVFARVCVANRVTAEDHMIWRYGTLVPYLQIISPDLSATVSVT
jgi:hypothetical protein